MGLTFPNPKYFYEESDVPDLVDTNGPIYSRTGVNLGNIVPTGVYLTAYKPDGTFLTRPSIDIVQHDVHVTRTVLSPMLNDSEEPILAIGLNGYIEISAQSSLPTTDDRCTHIALQVAFNDFNPGGTCQSAIGCAITLNKSMSETTGNPLLMACGTAYLQNDEKNDQYGRYPGDTIGSAFASLPCNFLSGHIDSAASIVFF